MSLKAEKGLKERTRKQCKAETKDGGVCQAPAVERGLCFFHANPEKPAELGRQGGKRNRHWKIEDGDLPQIPFRLRYCPIRRTICESEVPIISAQPNPTLSCALGAPPGYSHKPRNILVSRHRRRNCLHKDLACTAANGGKADMQITSGCSCSAFSSIVETDAIGRALALCPARRRSCIAIMPTISSASSLAGIQTTIDPD